MSDATAAPQASSETQASPQEEPPLRPPIATSPISVIQLTEPGRPFSQEVVNLWRSHLDGLKRDYELVVSGCNATEATHAEAPLGDALRSGLQQAHYPLVFYVTADGCYQPDALDRLLKWIDKVDVVIGYRTSAPPISWKEILYRLTMRWFFGVRVRDLGCVCVLARRSIFARIPVQSHGILAHAEVLAKANFLGCLMTEAPVAYCDNAYFRRPNWRQVFAEARQLFARPDFGPPFLPDNNKKPIPPSNS